MYTKKHANTVPCPVSVVQTISPQFFARNRIQETTFGERRRKKLEVFLTTLLSQFFLIFFFNSLKEPSAVYN